MQRPHRLQEWLRQVWRVCLTGWYSARNVHARGVLEIRCQVADQLRCWRDWGQNRWDLPKTEPIEVPKHHHRWSTAKRSIRRWEKTMQYWIRADHRPQPPLAWWTNQRLGQYHFSEDNQDVEEGGEKSRLQLDSDLHHPLAIEWAIQLDRQAPSLGARKVDLSRTSQRYKTVCRDAS